MVAPITRTEHLGEYRGYHLYRDWYPGARRRICAGYRASSAPRDVRGGYDPADVRDGEEPHFDSEADVRAAIDATHEAPLTALQRDAVSLRRLSLAESRAPIYQTPGRAA